MTLLFLTTLTPNNLSDLSSLVVLGGRIILEFFLGFRFLSLGLFFIFFTYPLFFGKSSFWILVENFVYFHRHSSRKSIWKWYKFPTRIQILDFLQNKGPWRRWNPREEKGNKVETQKWFHVSSQPNNINLDSLYVSLFDISKLFFVPF